MMPRCLPSLLCCGMLLLAACTEEGDPSQPQEDVVEEPILPISVSVQPATYMSDLGQRPSLMLELDDRPRYDPEQVQAIIDAIVLIRLSDGVQVPVTATWTNPAPDAELQEWREAATIAVNPIDELEESWHWLSFSKPVEGVSLRDSGVAKVSGTIFHPSSIMMVRRISVQSIEERPPLVQLQFTQPLGEQAELTVFGDGEPCPARPRSTATLREYECPQKVLEKTVTFVGLDKLSAASDLPLTALDGKPMPERFELSLSELDGSYPASLWWMPAPTDEMAGWLSQP
ncbi:MAG: hypothetical protein RBU37_10875 [Myxococcota bacterium]|nr:hypothetical protein [Myxococcota bacterium]